MSHVLIRWRTVVKHEAMAIRSSRLRLLGGGDAGLDAREAVELPGPSERATDRERRPPRAGRLGDAEAG